MDQSEENPVRTNQSTESEEMFDARRTFEEVLRQRCAEITAPGYEFPSGLSGFSKWAAVVATVVWLVIMYWAFWW